ncbi:exonuclease II Exo2 [Coemansia sp. RSA 1933]|nr:exonuclease II Exo2 [Coemansia sp. RSA 1933]
MGVPGLMRWLQLQFPSACQQLTRLESSYLRPTHSLCIDLNGTLHQNAQQTNGDVTSVSETIETIVRLVKPQHTLYLAIDGVPPRIKERLQRERRERNAARTHGMQDLFGTYAITPGSWWMQQLEQHLTEFIEEKRRGEWRRLRVVFSGHGDPGEGEQKIMDYLCRAQQQQATHYVWSNDADTVLLSLGTHVRNIMLVNDRSHGVSLSSFVVTDIDRLTTALVDRYAPVGASSGANLEERSRRQLIDDLVFMSFLAGNDFLPPTSMVASNADGRCIDILWTLYTKLPPTCRGFVNSDGSINHRTLSGLLAQIEETYEKKGFQKHVGVTMLGPQLTAMRIRRMAWEQQQQKLHMEGVSAASSDATLSSGDIRESRCTCRRSKRTRSRSSGKSRSRGRCTNASCSCHCHRGKHQGDIQVPFVWTGPLDKLDKLGVNGAQFVENNDIAALDGARVIEAADIPKWHPFLENMECPSVTLNSLPLLCPVLLEVFRVMVSLATGERVLTGGGARVSVEMLQHIGSNRAKWLQSAGIMLGQEIKLYDAWTRSNQFEILCKDWTQEQTVETEPNTVLVGLVWAGSDDVGSIVSIQPSGTAHRAAEAKSLSVALVGSDAWNVLYEDSRTENKRDHEYLVWKDAFYRQCYGSISDGSATTAVRLSSCYMDALEWTTLYYFGRRVSSWQFTWPDDIESTVSWVAPLASDLLAHLDNMAKSKTTSSSSSRNVRWDLALYSEGSPPLLREHLLSVMPSEAWASILTDTERELAKYLAECKFSAEARQRVHAQLLALPTPCELSMVRLWP